MPLAQWFRGGIRDYAYHHLIENRDPYLSSPFVQKMWDQHQSEVRDRSTQLWNVLMFRLWYKRFQS